MKELPQLLCAQRIRLGLTTKEVARMAQVGLGTYSALEGGLRADCSLATCNRICQTLGFEITVGLRGQTTLPEIPATARHRVRRQR